MIGKIHQITVICLAFAFAARTSGIGRSTPARKETSPAKSATPAIKVNRTVPKVHPAATTPHFSANPAAVEFFRIRIFEEPLVPIGGEPTANENKALAAALLGYARRSGPDDFSSVTSFLEQYSRSPWRAALLMNLGIEYYNTAHYSKTMEAWAEAWKLSKDATDAKEKAIADRAVGELAHMYSRLGMMNEMESLLKSVEGRMFIGGATERIAGAREALATMRDQPEISFRCGPLALHRIKLSIDPKNSGVKEIIKSASTRRGVSLPQVAELSKQIGLNYQMAYREKGAEFVVPSVVHWKVGHYAALIRQEGDRYLLEDPTFGNDVWATKQALEDETSGYFLVPPGKLAPGWRSVEADEGASVWGKGLTAFSNPGDLGPPQTSSCSGDGEAMAVSSVDLMLVNLNLSDTPVGYAPPVGPPARFTIHYNHRDAFQPANFTYSNFGPKWTCDWISYITDNPQSPSASVTHYIMGGATRTFIGFDPATQSWASQPFEHTILTRTGNSSYQITSGDGSKLIFAQPDGSVSTSRKVFLTKIIDPAGNILTLTYDANLRIVAVTDAIGQVTTLSYANPNNIYEVTNVTDPFGRFATFDYDGSNRLDKITDVIGITSQFTYEGSGDFINSLVTPYGTTSFTHQDSGGANGTTRFLETHYPDGSRERVEYNQYVAFPDADPAKTVPAGMNTLNQYHEYRNTYYWSRKACDIGYGDYSKAKVYHWLHTDDFAGTAGILESVKEPLENRVWYDYAGQSAPHAVGSTDRPSHVGRVLDDGTTQLYTYTYNDFGEVTKSIDPLGRELSYTYSSDGLDLLEIRQTRAGNNELLQKRTYNAQHLPLTQTDAAGQTTTYTYNGRGQLLTVTNPKNETTTYMYDANGYLTAVDGPLPGTSDVATATYDGYGRTHTRTDVDGYTITLDYDALDRVMKMTHPDGTYNQITYDRLDPSIVRDRAGRQTFLEFDAMGQMIQRTDHLGRTNLFEWCSCGDLKSLTDAMGRTTTWNKDVQGRMISKQFGDGSKITYFYEGTTSRLRQVVDEKNQVTRYTYNLDDTLRSTSYLNTAVPTPSVTYTYDPNYQRLRSMTDGTGTTSYSYVPITSTPANGAGQLASEDGPLPNDTITYGYDELGRRVSTAINGVAVTETFDPAGRVTGETNALGSFTYGHDGSTARLLSKTFPNGLTGAWTYMDTLHDHALQQTTYSVGATPISQFVYGRDIPASRITSWSQQTGAQAPSVFSLGYDDENQVLSATVTVGATQTNSFNYSYDPAGNRLTEQLNGTTNTATYNALNQLSTESSSATSAHTNEWDGADRLTAVNSGNNRTELTYDGLGRLASIRALANGNEVSLRRFIWCDSQICEERTAAGSVVKRFFRDGVKLETGPNAGSYFYTRDHLSSVRELIDGSGMVRARYSYDPFGRRTKVTGDLDADFAFTGMFWSSEISLGLTRFRAYDPELGRWLSRDPLPEAELHEGANLYAYVANDPVNKLDPLGLKRLCCQKELDELKKVDMRASQNCQYFTEKSEACYRNEAATNPLKYPKIDAYLREECYTEMIQAQEICAVATEALNAAEQKLADCTKKHCPPCKKKK
jgi:RHS repeat-associated protein